MSVVCPDLMKIRTITALKLSRSNYHYWKISVASTFIQLGVEDHLTGPPRFLSKSDNLKWIYVESQLLCLLLQSIERDLSDLFLSCPTCQLFWKAAWDMNFASTRASAVVSEMESARRVSTDQENTESFNSTNSVVSSLYGSSMSVVFPDLKGTPTITATKLSRGNYFFWEITVKRWFTAQGLKDHLVEDPPTYLTATDFQKWKHVDAQLVCLLWLSIEPDVGNVFRGCESCKSFWKAAKDMDTIVTRAYAVVCDWMHVRQEERGLQEYINEFRGLMAGLDFIFPTSRDAKTKETQQQQYMALLFLRGLNSDHECMRAEILKFTTLPTLEEVISYIRQTWPHCWDKYLPPDHPARVAHTHGECDSSIHGRRFRDSSRGNVPRSRCSYCNKWGHVIETCWTLHGRPPH